MINKITLKNLRRFDNFDIDITKNKVIFIGPNAIGKTTILEAINIASITKSHRTNNFKEVIKNNTEYSDIKIYDDNTLYRAIISKEGKSFFMNKNDIKKLSDYIGLLPSIFFSPYDLEIVNGGPGIKRSFLNKELSQLNKNYLKDLSLYNNYLSERNACLKQDTIDKNYLNIITSELIEYGKKIVKKRDEFINQINLIINNTQKSLCNNENIKLEYKPSIKFNEFDQAFDKYLESDIRFGQTEHGPQRDDILIYLNDKDVSKYGSQGQIRSVVLSLKICLLEIYKKEIGKYPILLLDDVMSELDQERLDNLLKIISNYGQTFITCVNTQKINQTILNDFQVIEIKERGN